MIMLFGKSGIITRFLLGIYDNSVYGFWGIAVVQTLTFFPVCYMMLKGLLKNIDPSLEEAARDMGASRFKVFTSVTLPLMLPGLGNAFLVTFIESIADFANPMLIGGSYDTLATTIYLQITLQRRINVLQQALEHHIAHGEERQRLHHHDAPEAVHAVVVDAQQEAGDDARLAEEHDHGKAQYKGRRHHRQHRDHLKQPPGEFVHFDVDLHIGKQQPHQCGENAHQEAHF